MTNEQKILHLHQRAGFGLSPEEWGQYKGKNIKQLLNNLFDIKKLRPIKTPLMDIPDEDAFAKANEKQKQELKKQAIKLTIQVNTDWVERMIKPDSSALVEKMAFFWHGHFACEPKFFHFATPYVNTIRNQALGNFKDLVMAISKDAAMIIYLNNQQNRKNKPNENYARELMELFTIGRGNYTENDIKEAAKAFTGWFTNRKTGEFEFKDRAHDFGSKTFMGQRGNFDGGDIIDIILSKKETAYFIAKKVYRFFVNEITINEKQVQELATVFFDSKYDIAKMMRYLFEADWFYADKNAGAKIKSPVELMVGMAKLIDLKTENEMGWLFPQRALGQILFKPPNVAGWPGGKTWIDNSTLMLRLNFAALLFDKAEVGFRLKDSPEAANRGAAMKKLEISANLDGLIKSFGKLSDDKMGEEMAAFLLPVPVKLDNPLFGQYVSAAKSPEDKVRAWALVLIRLPEFQLC